MLAAARVCDSLAIRGQMGAVKSLLAIALSGLFACAAVNAAIAAPSSACSRAGKPWVSVRFGDGSFKSKFRQRVLDDLKAGLSARDIDACAAGEAGEPATAEVLIELPAENTASVQVRDALTHKSLQREVDLSLVPEDSRAFAIALATDELVWASWAEIALAPKRRKPTTAPKEVVEAVQEDMGGEPSKPTELLLRGSIRHFPKGYTLYGIDGALVVGWAPRWLLDVSLGLGQGEVVQAPRGAIHSQSAGLGVATRFVVVDGAVARWDLGLGSRVSLLSFEGRAGTFATSDNFSTLMVDARALSTLSFGMVGPFGVEAAAGAGYTLRGAEATDTGQRAIAAIGLEWLGSLGLLLEL